MRAADEKELKAILGGTYGGPSISFEGGKLVIYRWYDAPVGDEILAAGDTLTEMLEDYRKKNRKKKKK